MPRLLAPLFFSTLCLLTLLSLGGGLSLTAGASPAHDSSPTEALPPGAIIETLLAEVDAPVSLALDGQGRIFYTQLDGKVRLYAGGALQPAPVITFTGFVGGQGCIDRRLVGIALDPQFATNRYVYVSITDPDTCNTAVNKVIRFTENGDVGSNPTTIFTSTQTATVHGIESIGFGPDGKLYVSMGEDYNPANAQDVTHKGGKIHRINPDGSIPANNPVFTQTGALPSLYAMGFRNSFDFAFDTAIPGTRIFATENGPECDDELNLIRGGHNYGWRAGYPCDDANPDPQHNTIRPSYYFTTPIAPTGVEVYTGGAISEWQNSLFMCSFNGGAIKRFLLSADRTQVTGMSQVEGVQCTMDVKTGPDGALYYIEGGGYTPGSIKRVRMNMPPACSTLSGEIVSSPNVVSGTNSLRSIDALSGSDAWAAGSSASPGVADSARTLILHWNGNQWSTMLSPNSGSGDNNLNGVSAAGVNDVWAVGHSKNSGSASQRTLILKWNGSQWNTSTSPSTGTGDNILRGVDALSGSDVWAVGYYSDTLASADTVRPLTLRWDGAQWNNVPAPDFGVDSDARLIAVEAISASDVWAVGNLQGTPTGNEETLIIHWNGVQWSRVPSPNAGGTLNFLRGVSAAASNDVWAVGYYGPRGEGRSLALHYDGVAWSTASLPQAGTFDFLLDVEALSAGNVMAVGNYYEGAAPRTLVMRWDGGQWGIIASPNAGAGGNYLFGVAASGPNDIWGAGHYEQGSGILTLVERFGPPKFSDLPSNNTFFPSVSCLVCRGIVSGYNDGTFRPNAEVTRGQLSKIVSNSAGYDDDPGAQRFQDVPTGSTFYAWINRLAGRGHIGGYDCGGPGEPCVAPANLPYFRPNANATRGQISKIVSNAAGYSDTPTGQTFEDVPPANTFYLWIERLAVRGIMGGYACGVSGEICVPPDYRPYFRWGNNATRVRPPR